MFKINDDYVVAENVLISYIGNQHRVHVPSTIEGHTIQRIGDGAFWEASSVEEIIVDDGVKSIGSKAFGKCQNLRYIRLPESVDEIAEDAFYEDELYKLDFYLKVPYSRYLNLKEGAIRLADGRWLLDPMSLGAKDGNMIHGFMPDCLSKKFRIKKEMGYLFADDRQLKDSDGKIEILAFDSLQETNDEWGSFAELLKRGRCDIWYESEELVDDPAEIRNVNKINTISAQLFWIKEGHKEEDYINLNFRLKKSGYFFHRGEKVCLNGKSYFICQRVYITARNERPFVRVNTIDGLYCDDTDFSKATLEEVVEVMAKYNFL